jgi:DNA-binding transcriptional MocR family regulator
LNSFSKVLAPGLRLGWLSATPSIVDQIALIKQRLDPHTQNLVQFALARLLRDGSFDKHVKTLRAEHSRRCGLMLAAMHKHVPQGSLRVMRPQGGLYLWCRVAPGISTRALHAAALANGVAFVPGHAFYADPAGDSELRLCFSSVLPKSIDVAMKKLGASIRECSGAETSKLAALA